MSAVAEEVLDGLLSDDRQTWAAKVAHAGRIFYIRFWSDEANAREKQFPQHVAQEMGISLEQLRDKDFERTAAQNEIYENEMNALREMLVADALMGVTKEGQKPEQMVTVPAEAIAKLRPDVKRVIADFTVSFCRHGLGEQEFFRLRDGAPLRGA